MANSYNADIARRRDIDRLLQIGRCAIFILWFSGQKLQRIYRTSTSCSNRSVTRCMAWDDAPLTQPG